MDFEKLDVWKRSAALSAQLYTTLKSLPDFGFRDQITRAGLSVPCNIAEGMVRESPKERLRFLNIAQGSCAELRTQIYIGIRVGYIGTREGPLWVAETREIGRMIFGLSERLRQNRVSDEANEYLDSWPDVDGFS